jgi:ABC-2 type transport system ATP-binding protein
MAAVKMFCNKALLIEGGEIKMVGSPEKIANQYTLDNFSAEKTPDQPANLNPSVKNLAVSVRKSILDKTDKLIFTVTYALNEAIPVDLGISIISRDISVIEQNTQALALPHTVGEDHSVTYTLPLEQLNPGRYSIGAVIFEKEHFKPIGFIVDYPNFVIKEGEKMVGGILSLQGKWGEVS